MSSTSRRLIKTAIPAAPLLLGVVPTAHAAVIYTNIADQTISDPNARIYLDFGTGGSGGSFSSSFFAAADATLQFGQTAYVNNINNPATSVFAYSSHISTTSAFATKFSYGATIGGSLGSAAYAKLTSNPGVTGNWTNNGSHGYLGFQIQTGVVMTYAWAQVSYNADKSFTLYDFAYESSGGSLAAGAIPEPSTTAALAGLLAGSAVLYAKRRRQKKAA